MKKFQDEQGKDWVATAVREETVRHHSLWHLTFKADGSDQAYPVPEIVWQTEATADRTLKTMSDFELRRRLKQALGRHTTV